MRRIILSCFVAIVYTIAVYAGTVEIPITIQVQNASTNILYIQQAHLDQSQLTKTHRIDLTNGYAQFVYQVEQSGFIELVYNGYIIPMYLDKHSVPTVSFDGSRIAETLHFSGTGAANNNFIAEYAKVIGGTEKVTKECSYLEIYFGKLRQYSAQTLNAQSFAKANAETYNNQLNVLSTHRSSIDNEVYDFYAKKALYDREASKLLWMLERSGALGEQNILSEKNTLGLDESVVQKGGGDINHPAYQNLLKASAIWKYLPNDINKHRAYSKIYPLIEQNFYGESRCYLTSHLLVKVYEKSGETELGRSKISQLQNECPQYTAQIMEMYGGDISGVENIAAAEIDMMDKAGGLVALGDYRGKVVYMSFWASWCKPCIEGFKKTKEIRKQLQDMGVVLVNISIDKKEEAWRDAMIRHNPLGVNTWALSLQELAKDYDISAIPLYHIVNKQGKFSYLSNEGGRNIVEEFRTLVEQ